MTPNIRRLSAFRHVVPWLLVASVLGLSSPARAQDLPRVIIRTAMGDMEAEIDTIHAPVTSANFLRYVDLGFYRFGRFHRTVRADNQPTDKVKIGVIQAGLDSLRVKDFPPIKLERTRVTGLLHKDGTISMARDGPDTGDVGLLHLYRRPALARLRRQAQPGRPRIRGVRAAGPGDGRGSPDPGRSRARTEAAAAGGDSGDCEEVGESGR